MKRNRAAIAISRFERDIDQLLGFLIEALGGNDCPDQSAKGGGYFRRFPVLKITHL